MTFGLPFAPIALPALLLTAACSASAASPPQTVVLVTLDTLRPDHLSCYGYPRETSPFLDRMAAEGVRFTKAIASSSHTAPTHASIFTSLQPIQHRVLENGQRLRPEFPSVASVLREAGYDTAAFISVGFLQGLDHGFDHFVPGDYSDTANDVLGRAEAWLRARRETPDAARPLFLWLHLYDAHQPYQAWRTEFFRDLQRLTEEERQAHFEYVLARQGVVESFIDEVDFPDGNEAFTPAEILMKIVDQYDAEIHLADGALEHFYGALSELGLNRDALWVFVADHGEGLGAHRLLGHDRHVFQEQLHIPLIVHGTGGRVEAGVHEGIVRQVDLLPTILDWAEVPLPEDGPAELQGRSLMHVLAGRAEDGAAISLAFSQRRAPVELWRNDAVYVIQTQRYKFVQRSDARDQLFDLEEDPFEQVNLVDSERWRSEKMRRSLRYVLDGFEASSAVEPLVDGDGHGAELDALGYSGR